MTLAEKKMETLGLHGKIMYMSRKQVTEARGKYPDAKIVRCSVEPASMVKGYHAYFVKNWEALTNAN